MNENDAKLVAFHLYRLMHKELLQMAMSTRQQVLETAREEILNSRQAAIFLDMSYDEFKRRINDIPHHKECKGGKIRCLKSELILWVKTK